MWLLLTTFRTDYCVHIERNDNVNPSISGATLAMRVNMTYL